LGEKEVREVLHVVGGFDNAVAGISWQLGYLPQSPGNLSDQLQGGPEHPKEAPQLVVQSGQEESVPAAQPGTQINDGVGDMDDVLHGFDKILSILGNIGAAALNGLQVVSASVQHTFHLPDNAIGATNSPQGSPKDFPEGTEDTKIFHLHKLVAIIHFIHKYFHFVLIVKVSLGIQA